jgi:histidinol-phosphate aminotransferase
MILDTLRRLPGIQPFESDANFVLVRFGSTSVARWKTELDRRGLMLKFFNEADFVDCARITLGTPEENARLVAAFHEICGQAAGAPVHGPSMIDSGCRSAE